MLVTPTPGYKRLRLPAIALCLWLLGGCASFNGLPGASHRYSESAVVLEVPYEKQRTEYLCGLAVADMVSGYYGVPLVAGQRERLQEEASQNGGISGKALKAAFQASGYTAVVFAGSLDREVMGLYQHLDQRRPVVVMYAAKTGTPGHYVVVAGYDPVGDVLVVLDPDGGRRTETRRSFLRKWKPSGRFTLLAMPERKASESVVLQPKP